MNHVVLIGRLTKDPELRHIASTGRAVTSFTLAVDKNLSKEKKTEMQQKGISTADFIKINAWGKLAETATQYLSKGKRVAIEGSITTGSFKTPAGETRYTTEITAHNLGFLDKADKSERQDSLPIPDQYEDDFAAANFSDDEVPF
ncbi:MAG: single-stranded DNA-binding protein [Acidaminobacter sp.]|uniref:single-stranded DNA-binding protein n=1 Tax=Acidaminobacter sp. TaxID=1872102 RepID=UPI0013851873|nr:single-stranded DNA-binding protein [Acidaminobacter sp.]MZQ99492.1 single-stranded DNA-binding protein [Acidaminobacter sp.]